MRADDSAVFGPAALAFIEQFSVQTAIVSAAALSAEQGLMDNHLCEAEICRALIKRAERVIVTADSSKFTAKGLIAACGFDEIDLVITDMAPPPHVAEKLEAADVQVMIAE